MSRPMPAHSQCKHHDWCFPHAERLRPLTMLEFCYEGIVMRKLIFAAALAGAATAASAQQVNIICSVQAEWCNMISTVYARTTGVKGNLSLKVSGEALALLIAEKENPKTDIWFGGTGDPHLQ